ncbi:MAG: hypothetical protein JHD07_13720 [Bradyrhizobium sp.]|uniref:hypothetical protein n=1 Tax=Bradyrhizobium sp. TaxID=376 RepID=UPI001A2CAF5F|nr:hypothetical protein [Bradyrhizobium sp.]MBJ7404289.1 hypothetical protein [Bradyrhizobium sp.]
MRPFWPVIILAAFLSALRGADARDEMTAGRAVGDIHRDVQTSGTQLILYFRSEKACRTSHDPEHDWLERYRRYSAGINLLEALDKNNVVSLRRESFIVFRRALADAALKSGCLNIADEQYRSILERYREPAFQNYRDLAKIGIEDVRERRRQMLPRTEFGSRFTFPSDP